MGHIISLLFGGLIGTLLRYLIITKLAFSIEFFWGTIAVNILGALGTGLACGFLDNIMLSQASRLFLFSGFFGAFTTFSTFALDIFTLINLDKIKTAFLYFAITNIVGILLLFSGFKIAKILITKNITL